MRIEQISRVVEVQPDAALRKTGEKIINKERIFFDEGVMLFEKAGLPYIGALANYVRERLHGNKTYFNRNFHIEPTNVCVFSCAFCSYSRLYAQRDEGWELSIGQMMDMVKKYDGKPVTEVHIVVVFILNESLFLWNCCKNKSPLARPAYKGIYGRV